MFLKRIFSHNLAGPVQIPDKIVVRFSHALFLFLSGFSSLFKLMNSAFINYLFKLNLIELYLSISKIYCEKTRFIILF